jgi:flagellar P-ring protein precursor FlgI
MQFVKSQRLLVSVLVSPLGAKLVGAIAVLLIALVMLMSIFIATVNDAHASARIKDIVTVEGIRDNILIGYGLVVGLNGTGDKLNNSAFTEKSLQSFLDRLGVNTGGIKLNVKNVAAVTVTGTLPPFSRAGSRIDVTVSALGDASSLQGGMLISTPLKAADNKIYAVGQGAITLGGFVAQGKSQVVSKGVPTNGYISNGAIIEREVDFELDSLSELKFALRNPDITTASRIAAGINGVFTEKAKLMAAEGEVMNESVQVARVMDPGTVIVQVPEDQKRQVASFLAELELLEVETDQSAKIIIDEASGTIVINENVRIDTVAISQGNLVVTIKEIEDVSQPNTPLAGGEAVPLGRTEVEISEPGTKMAVMERGASLKELVDGLNALGVGPRDLVTILQTIKVAGALQAQIEMK